MDYLVIRYEDHTNETFFENIYKLDQFHNLSYDLKTNEISINKSFESTGKKFTAIHAKSTEKKNDESIFTEEVNKHCNLDLNIVEPSKKEFIEKLDEVIYTQEEPFWGPSVFMQYFVYFTSAKIRLKILYKKK